MAIWGVGLRVAADHAFGRCRYGITTISPTVLPTELLTFGATRSFNSTYVDAPRYSGSWA